MRTLNEMMWRMGFAATDTGPNVTALRKIVERQISEGMVGRSAGTWAPEHGPAGMRLAPEERARAFLEIEWAIEHGHWHEVKNIDRNGDAPLTMIGDKIREAGFHIRVWRDRLLGRRNPHSQ